MARRGFAHLVMLVTTLGAPMPAPGRSRPAEANIVGSWLTTVELDDGTTLLMLNTFLSDGNVISRRLPASAAAPGNARVKQVRGGIETWRRIGSSSFSGMSARLLADVSGNHVASETFTWDVKLFEPGDVFGGTGDYHVVGPSGRTLVARSATISGTRVKSRKPTVAYYPPGAATPAA